MEAEIKHLEDAQLANGVLVQFYDESRRVAGDRWQVRVRYNAVVAVSESFWSLVDSDPKMIEGVRAALGTEVVLTNVNERNFVAEVEKEEMVAEVVSRARKDIFGYLSTPEFPESYFKRCFKDAREKIELEQRAAFIPDDDDIEEPDDFSHIFADVNKSE